MENMINIVDLHLDVLVLIFEQIESFADKANLAKAHKTLWNAFVYYSRKDVLTQICFDEYNKQNEHLITHWRFILEWCGSKVTTIISKYNTIDSGDLFEIATKYCPNLQVIQFVITEDNLNKIVENVSKLTMLKTILLKCDLFTKVMKIQNYTAFNEAYSRAAKKTIYLDNLIELFQNLKNLQRLNFGVHYLKKNERIQLNKLIHLDDLKIGRLEAPDVADIASMLRNLRTLTIEYYPDTETLTELAKYCTALEYLSLEDYNNRSFDRNFSSKWRIAYFPNLISLHVFKGSCHSDFLHNLDTRYNNHLQILNIPCLSMDPMNIKRVSELRALKTLFCSYILPSAVEHLVKMQIEHINYWDSGHLTKNDILKLVRECKTLKVLNIVMDDIDAEFVCDMLDILELNGFKAEKPFVFSNRYYRDRKERVYEEIRVQFASNPKSNLMKMQLD